MKKTLTTALFATVAGALTFGAAASLDVNAENLGAGAAAVLSCDDAVDVGYGFLENEPELVGTIIINDVSEACLTQHVTVSVSNEASAVIAMGDAWVEGTTVYVDLTPTANYTLLSDSVRAADIYEVSVTVTGAPVGL